MSELSPQEEPARGGAHSAPATHPSRQLPFVTLNRNPKLSARRRRHARGAQSTSEASAALGRGVGGGESGFPHRRRSIKTAS